MAFLNWLYKKIVVALWNNITARNMNLLLEDVLTDASFSLQDVMCLNQVACTKSMYMASTTLNKPIFFKELAAFVHFVGLSSLENILLIDDSQFKNLMNDPHNTIFPLSFSSNLDDNYLKLHLVPWLDGLFKSNEVVLDYVKNNLLFGN